jgi:hypothetical protein
MIRVAMSRLRASILAVLVSALAAAVPAQARAALSNDGTVTVEYSGKLAQTYVANPRDPAQQQGKITFVWDETATFALSGRAEQNERSRLVDWKLTVSGGHRETFAPPNSGLNCNAAFSKRPGARNPISVFYSHGAVGVTATMPVGGQFVQSSDADPRSHCYVPPTGGLDFPSPDSATLAYEHMLLDEATVRVPSNPFSRRDSANGSGIAGDGSQVTQSLSGVLQVRTNGRTSPPPNQKLTPAEIQAKSNALEALKQTLPAALYPCVTLAAGTTLLSATPIGIAVGGTLVAVAGGVCADYYKTILAEIATVKDPPRGDFNLLASASSAAAASPARRLLGAADATRSAAEAIATTLGRETGARHAHDRAAAARQDRRLKALNGVFARRRVAEATAGRGLATQIRRSGSAPRLSAAQVQAAETTLIGRLSAHGLTPVNVRFARSLLRSGPLAVLSTLGR